MKTGQKVIIKNMDGTGIGFSQNAKTGIIRNVYRIDDNKKLSIILKINKRLYGFSESNLELVK